MVLTAATGDAAQVWKAVQRIFPEGGAGPVVRGWTLVILDVEGAFLQGKPLERHVGLIYVELPSEKIPGVAPGSLVQGFKCVYGLMDAPRQWYDSFMITMEGLGMKNLYRLDPCVLYSYDGDELGGI